MNSTTKNGFSMFGRYLLPLLLVCLPAMSQAENAMPNISTLAHIRSSHTLNVGFRENPPFSYTDSGGKITGYTIALCNMIAKSISSELGLKKMAVHYIPVSFAERMAFLNSRKIDIDCSVNADTPERTGSVTFSKDYFVARMRIVSLRRNNLLTLHALKGKTVSIPAGSKDLLEMNRINREQQLNMSLVSTVNVQSAFDRVIQNHTSAMILDDILAWPLINQSGQPDDFTVSHETFGPDMKYALMIKKDEPAFVSLVNQSLEDILHSPGNAELSKRWLTTGTLHQPVAANAARGQ